MRVRTVSNKTRCAIPLFWGTVGNGFWVFDGKHTIYLYNNIIIGL